MGGLVRSIGKIFKKVTPIIGAVVGTYLGGPVGGTIGGAIGGASTRGGGNKLKGALSGGMQGAGYASMAPQLAANFFPNSAFAAQATGLNAPSFLSQLGMSSAPNFGGGMGLFGNVGEQGLLNGILGPGGSGLGGIAKGLLGGGGGSSNFSGQSIGHSGGPQSMLQQIMSYQPQQSQGAYASQDEKFLGNSASDEVLSGSHASGSGGLSPMESFLIGSAPEKKRKRENTSTRKWINPNDSQWQNPNDAYESQYAKGGRVKNHGYIKVSDTGGQDDDIHTILPHDSYVWNATDLSLLGDGFSDNGAKKLSEFEMTLVSKGNKKKADTFTLTGITKPYDGHTQGVRARVSNGEYRMSPAAVAAIGDGSVQKGVKIIDKMRKNLRAHKGVKSILPPKTKDFHYYMKGGK